MNPLPPPTPPSLDRRRRALCAGSLAGSAALLTGVIAPRHVLAEWNRAAFAAPDPESALQALLGQATLVDDATAVRIESPSVIRGDGDSTIAVTVTSTLPEVRSITLILTGQPRPLTAAFVLGPLARPRVCTHLRLERSAELIAIVEHGGRLLRAHRAVQVNPGNCAR